MPYADREKQAAYNREWWKNWPRIADTPLCRDVEETVRRLGPVARASIVAEIGRSNTNSVGVALARLKKAGRAKRIGYGKWVPSDPDGLLG